MATIPKDGKLDSSLSLLREGNHFIPRRCQRHQSDIFQTRLLLEPTLCLHGEAAARLFYDQSRFTREGAAPGMLKKTLFGEGGVQGLDGEAHRIRKQLFMSLMSATNIRELAELASEEWLTAIDSWQRRERVVLLHAVQEIHLRAACRWADLPLYEAEIAKRCADIAAMIDGGGGGGIGWRYWRARRARICSEAWVGDLVERIRAGRLAVDKERALSRVCWHQDADGQLLDTQTAAVEVLNLIRPTVAIARYVTFAALALHEHPQWRQPLQSDASLLDSFVEEVRRYYGFFPFVAARVRDDFTWQGYQFTRGTRVLLDLFGTNRDPRSWQDPTTFQPDRFIRETANAYNFIPQGGGEHDTNHRCPGEWFTQSLIKVAIEQLLTRMRYRVPPQALDIDWSRMPIIPESRFVIDQVEALPYGQAGQATGEIQES
ncbi:cytochrome P450 [Halomonas sp. HP20-15]|uniref:cytochrome P450 n=1 Tax=Halomonas sp. HP20-15 TaxID=3085901 RepID=UPI002980C22F|nr:cytochrome P450 [Halomonas sp. HP20-15]MDW5375648.1 cytochrome P450 [Halomonas sp. HP20-15]